MTAEFFKPPIERKGDRNASTTFKWQWNGKFRAPPGAPRSSSGSGRRSTSGRTSNIERIHQYQTGYTSGAGNHKNAVLRHANGAHNAANAHDPVVMNILKRSQAQRSIHPVEQKILDNRLKMNQKLLKGLEAHKHPSNVSYELDEEQNGNSYVEKLRNGARAGRVPVSSPEDSETYFRR